MTTIHDHETLKLFVQATASLKRELSKTKQAKREELTPILAQKKEIEEQWDPEIKKWESVEKEMKQQIAEYYDHCYFERDRLLADPTPGAVSLAQEKIPPSIKGLSVTKKWTCIPIDPNAIVQWCIDNNALQLLQPNEQALKNTPQNLSKKLKSQD